MVRELHKDPKVKFVGYKLPHPLQHHVELYIQTEEGYSPNTALEQAIARLLETIGMVKTRFQVSGVFSWSNLAACARAGQNTGPEGHGQHASDIGFRHRRHRKGQLWPSQAELQWPRLLWKRQCAHRRRPPVQRGQGRRPRFFASRACAR